MDIRISILNSNKVITIINVSLNICLKISCASTKPPSHKINQPVNPALIKRE